MKQIAAKVAKLRDDRTGSVEDVQQPEQLFLGYLTGCDLSGRRFSFVRVRMLSGQDDGTSLGDIMADKLKWEILDSPNIHLFNAYEVSGKQGMPPSRIVSLMFCDYRTDPDTGNKIATYTYYGDQLPVRNYIPPHDHRDNLNGGLAFAVYHPGTGLPQNHFPV